jgi:hypothetical protein
MIAAVLLAMVKLLAKSTVIPPWILSMLLILPTVMLPTNQLLLLLVTLSVHLLLILGSLVHSPPALHHADKVHGPEQSIAETPLIILLLLIHSALVKVQRPSLLIFVLLLLVSLITGSAAHMRTVLSPAMVELKNVKFSAMLPTTLLTPILYLKLSVILHSDSLPLNHVTLLLVLVTIGLLLSGTHAQLLVLLVHHYQHKIVL